MTEPFVILPGPPIADIAVDVFEYTTEFPTQGTVIADLNNFEALTITEILSLFKELPKVEKFVNPNFEGKFVVRNCGWAARAAISGRLLNTSDATHHIQM